LLLLAAAPRPAAPLLLGGLLCRLLCCCLCLGRFPLSLCSWLVLRLLTSSGGGGSSSGSLLLLAAAGLPASRFLVRQGSVSHASIAAICCRCRCGRRRCVSLHPAPLPAGKAQHGAGVGQLDWYRFLLSNNLH
jgi:hypothetical protein